jgi:hypothetical protein
MSNFNQRVGLSFTQDERFLLEMYINQYNQANIQINHLYTRMDNIRNNINNIIGISRETMNTNTNTNGTQRNNRNPFRTNLSRNTIPNINNLFNNNPYVFYDYNNPIAPTTYINNEPEIGADNYLSNLLSGFLSSTVPIRPSPSQITNATRLVRYSEIQNPISNSCPISLDIFQPNDEVRQIHYCGHIFSKSSFDEWFCNNVRCPVCRYDIRNYRPNISLPIPVTSPISPTHSRENTLIDENNEQPQDDNNVLSNTINNESSQNEVSETDVNNNENTVNNRRIRNRVNNNNNSVNTDGRNRIRRRNNSANSSSSSSNSENSALDMLTTSIFESLLSYPARRYSREPETNDERLTYDPSLNIITYETIIRPNRNNNTHR